MTSRLPDACEAALAERLRPEFFKALADPSRIALVAMLAARPDAATVTEIAGCCDIDLSGVSRHLKILRAAGVVTSERRGREVVYALELDALAEMLRATADALEACRAT